MRYLFCVLSFVGLTACSAPVYAPVVPEAMEAPAKTKVFVATNRGTNAEGHFDRTRSTKQTYLETIVSLPEDRKPGEPIKFSNTPNIKKHYVVAGQRAFDNAEEFAKEIRRSTGSSDEVLVFVHGFYNTYANSLFRTAQIKQDMGNPSPIINFSWPSAGRALAYNYDSESVLYARDDLETLLRALERHGPENIVLVAHSRGTLLTTETLRQMEIKNPGWSRRNLDALVFIAPDEPLDVFHRALSRFDTLPQPFFILTTGKDKALRFSSRINGSNLRVGQITEASQLGDLPVVLIDVSNFSLSRNNNHSLFAESPALISLFRDQTTFETIVRTLDVGVPNTLEQTVQVFGDAVSIELVPPIDPGAQ